MLTHATAGHVEAARALFDEHVAAAATRGERTSTTIAMGYLKALSRVGDADGAQEVYREHFAG